jgi:hypothetical protein
MIICNKEYEGENLESLEQVEYSLESIEFYNCTFDTS